jgi:hypothetical protein
MHDNGGPGPDWRGIQTRPVSAGISTSPGSEPAPPTDSTVQAPA